MAQIPAYESKLAEAHWSSFKLYNGYRVLIALTLLLSHNLIQDWSIVTQSAFAKVTLGYLMFSLVSVVFTWFEKPKLELTLPVQIILDILFILLLMQADSSGSTVMGLLLVIAIAAASLISDGRLSLFYAAVATIGILSQQFLSSLRQISLANNYTSAVILSIACFAIAWLAHSLAARMQRSEQLASQRGLDLKGLAHINALITQRMKDGVIVVDRGLQIKHHNLQADVFLNLENQAEEANLTSIAPEIAALLTDWFTSELGSVNKASNSSTINLLSRELRISFLSVAESRDQGAVVFIEDWSQIQTEAHQVKLAALGRLTAKIAHEIRNPLSSISHANQLLQEDEEMPEANQRMLQIIEDNVERVDQIIKDVLELNRRDRTNQEAVSLPAFMTEFHQSFCSVENITADHFRLTIENNDDVILFDRRHLNQIIWNLCKNGWRHSRQQNNSLHLHVYTPNDKLVTNIEITDDGKGIPDNIKQHLFEPFFTTESAGTGLGLYISKELAEANGAHLQYQPSGTDENIGAQFVIQIKKATI